jgi:hypothetical protein
MKRGDNTLKLLNIGKSLKCPALDLFVEEFGEEFDRDWQQLTDVNHNAMKIISSITPTVLYPLFDGDDIEVYGWRIPAGEGSSGTPHVRLTNLINVSIHAIYKSVYDPDAMLDSENKEFTMYWNKKYRIAMLYTSYPVTNWCFVLAFASSRKGKSMSSIQTLS